MMIPKENSKNRNSKEFNDLNNIPLIEIHHWFDMNAFTLADFKSLV